MFPQYASLISVQYTAIMIENLETVYYTCIVCIPKRSLNLGTYWKRTNVTLYLLRVGSFPLAFVHHVLRTAHVSGTNYLELELDHFGGS